MYAPSEADLSYITQRAHGVCLDLGTGEGNSARAILESSAVKKLYIYEPDPEWRDKHGLVDPRVTEVMGYTRFMGFDFAYVDHFPLEDRLSQAETLASFGTEVMVDDAGLVPCPEGFHKHGQGHDSFWHYDPRGCPG